MLGRELELERIKNAQLEYEHQKLISLAVDICNEFVAPNMYKQAREYIEFRLNLNKRSPTMNKRFDEELEKIAYIKRKEWLGVFRLILLMAVITVLIIWGFSELYTKYI
jgi:hypothetical protein